MPRKQRAGRGLGPTGDIEMLNDLRLALRGLRRRPASTALAVTALALGIGANAAVFSFVDGIILRPLPFPEPDRLVDVTESEGMRSTSLGAVAPRDLQDFRAMDGTFQALSGSMRDGKNVSFTGSPERLTGLAVDPDYFKVLGIQPSLGRPFAADEEQPGNDAVVILSHRLFERRFDSTADILSRSIVMDGRAYRVVGVMPRDFKTLDDLDASAQIDYFVPAVLEAAVRANRGEHILDVVARLQPGVSVAAANTALLEISKRIAASEPDTNQDVRAVARPAQDVIAGPLKTPMLLLLAASALIFLIAAVNVGSLLAARAVEERRDVAVKVALGASRSRVVRESVVRSVLLAASGCALGLLTAFWLKGVLVAVAPARTPRLGEIALSGAGIAVACLLSIIGAALFGVLPALAVSRAEAADALRTGSKSSVSRRTRRGRSALLALEMGLSILPLVGATLLVRSLAALRGVDLGFETDRVLVANLPLPEGRYKTADARFDFFERLAERARALPGVEAVGFANRFPMRGGWISGIQFDGGGPDAFRDVAFQAVGGDYFQALGLALRRGREFESNDRTGAPPVAVVNEAFVRAHLAGDPIGQRFRRGPDRPWISIVGVVSDIRREGKTGEVEPQAYLAAAQTELYPVRLADFALRARTRPEGLIKPLQAAVWSLDPEQPLMNVRTLSETIDGALSPRRFQTLLLALFAGLAVLLSLIGVYGVVTTTVAQRTQEIGVRMALGARAATVARMVLAQSMAPLVLGLTLGLLASAGLARAMSGLVFGIGVLDPLTFVSVPLLLLLLAALACLAPTLRAARVEPVTALRDE